MRSEREEALPQGPMLPRSIQLEMTDEEHKECLQRTGEFMMGRSLKGCQSFESAEPIQAWVGRVESKAGGAEHLASTKGARAGSHETCCYGARADCTSIKSEGARFTKRKG